MIHFDDDPADMDAKLDPIRRTLAAYGTAPVLTSICVRPPDWDHFVEAVTRSTAQVVVPTIHGWQDGNIGPVNHDWNPGDEDVQLADRDWRAIDEVFPAGSISASTLLLYCCYQGLNQEKWRVVAPTSRLVLHDGVARRIAGLVFDLLGPNPTSLKTAQTGWRIVDAPVPAS